MEKSRSLERRLADTEQRLEVYLQCRERMLALRTAPDDTWSPFGRNEATILKLEAEIRSLKHLLATAKEEELRSSADATPS